MWFYFLLDYFLTRLLEAWIQCYIHSPILLVMLSDPWEILNKCLLNKYISDITIMHVWKRSLSLAWSAKYCQILIRCAGWWCWEVTANRYRFLFGVLKIFYNWECWRHTRLCEYTKNHRNVHFTWVPFVVCKWYLNTAVKNTISSIIVMSILTIFLLHPQVDVEHNREDSEQDERT